MEVDAAGEKIDTPMAAPSEVEDELVKEIDVVLSQDLGPQLSILQYPLRPPWRPYDSSTMHSVKFKPKQQKLQLEYELYDGKTPNGFYDTDSERQIRVSVLNSTLVSARTHYAIAILKNDTLYLTPILGGLFQLRPSFGHLDAEDAAKKKAAAEENAEEDGDEEEEDAVEASSAAATNGSGIKSIQVQFKKRESERAAAARQQSHQHLKALEEEEAWLELKPKTKNSFESEAARSRMCPESAADVPIAFDVSYADYLSLLHPPSAEPAQADAPPDTVLEGYTAESLRKLPLEEQLQTIFKYSTVMTFESVKGYIGWTSSDAELLRALDAVAVLVRGLLFAKPDLYFSPPQLYLFEYILLLFHENGTVSRTETFGLAKAEVRLLLLKIASAKASGWILKHVDEGAEFLRLHPEEAARSAKYWTARRNLIIANFHSQRDAADSSSAPAATAGEVSSSTSSSSIPFPGTNQREQLQNLLTEVLKKDGVCNITYLRQKLDEAKKSDASPYSLLKEPVDTNVLLSVLQRIADKLHDAYYLKTSGDPILDKWRNVLVTVFKEKLSVKRSDCNDVAQAQLGEPIPQNLWNKLIKEFAYSKNTNWIFKPGNGDAV